MKISKDLKKLSIISVSALTLLGVGYSSANQLVSPVHAKVVRHVHKHARRAHKAHRHLTKRSHRRVRKHTARKHRTIRHRAHKNVQRIAIIKATRRSIQSNMRTVRRTLHHTKNRSARNGLKAELKQENGSLRAMNRQLRNAEK